MLIPEEAQLTVYDYFKDITDFGYNTKFEELEFSKGKRNYTKITKELLKNNFQSPLEFKYLTFSLDELKTLLSETLNKIFDNRYKEQIQYLSSLIIPKKNIMPFEATLVENFKNGILVPEKIFICAQLTSVDIISTAHEIIHAMLTKYAMYEFNNILNNVHYKEFLSILVEYITCYELSKLIKEDKIIEKHNVIRMEHNKAQVSENEAAQSLKDKLYSFPLTEQKIMEGYIEYQAHNSYGYVLSDIYSDYLIDIYKQEPQTLINIISSVIDGQKCISNLLSQYKLNLSNNDIVFKFVNKINQTSKMIIK